MPRITSDDLMKSREGFTIVELVLVVIVFGLLLAIGLPQMGSMMRTRALVNARDAMVLTGARARAAAVEKGDVIRWIGNPDDDTVVLTSGGDTIHALNLNVEPAVDLYIASGELEVCYTPRGFVHPSCEDAGSLPVDLALIRNGDTAWVQMTVLGRIEK